MMWIQYGLLHSDYGVYPVEILEQAWLRIQPDPATNPATGKILFEKEIPVADIRDFNMILTAIQYISGFPGEVQSLVKTETGYMLRVKGQIFLMPHPKV